MRTSNICPVVSDQHGHGGKGKKEKGSVLILDDTFTFDRDTGGEEIHLENREDRSIKGKGTTQPITGLVTA
ncbi:hypothetical protein [Desulfobulbus alkaliphilus]|uniref:hypothetical protein n=1 Tax=Desulfobulbus alkaliphilus TaxID=869814 RepID=UPI00196331DE|nr:hypothetical protein [Desulfobulbus alkaliphilus]MBM9538493.1 hypothetical protein [Desulfobulbus alkaliphilus]